MKYKKITFNLFIAISAILISNLGVGQTSENIINNGTTPEGYNYITNFYFNNTRFFQNKFVIQDDNSKMIFSNERGILVFDGTIEKEYYFDREILNLKKDDNSGQIFAASKNSFGIIVKNKINDYEYSILFSDNKLNESFNNIIFFEGKVWFYGEKYVYSVSLSDLKTIKQEYKSETNDIKALLNYKSKLYIISPHTPPFDLIKKKEKKIKNYESVSDSKILFSVNKGNQILFGNDNNNLYLFDDTEFYNYKTSTQDYIEESVIIGGIDLSENQFVIYTLNGGAIIIDKNTRETLATINYRTGLPEDEIYSATVDNNNGLWLTHESGASRIALELPLRNYGKYPGLDGRINDLIIYKNSLYVATGKGLFSLNEIKNYKEIEKIIKVRDTSEEKPSRFLSKLFKPKKTAKENNAPLKTKVIELQSIKYSYSKIKDLNAKCTQLVKYDNGLLIATNNGLYFTKNNSIKMLISEININQISEISDNGNCYIATDKGIYELERNNNKYECKKLNFPEKPVCENKEFYSILIDKDNIWASSVNNIVLINKENDIYKIKNFDLNLSFSERVSMKKHDKKILFFSGETVYEYSGKQIIKNKELSKFFSYNSQTFFPNENSILIIQNGIPTYSKTENFKNENINLISLFKNYDNLIFDSENNIWVISKSNELFKIKPDTKQKQIFDFSIKNIKVDSVLTENNSSNIKLNYNNGKIEFSLSAPNYLKKNGVRYIYSIDSEYRNSITNNDKLDISLSQLKYREHTIKIFAVNALNQKSNIKEIKIFIKPPFWDSLYFWAGIFVFLSIIIALFFAMLSRQKQKRIIRRNEELETEVEIRTAKIKLQNEEILAQNEEILLINKKISIQNKEITDSISYASKIQTAVLTTPEILKSYVSEFFVIFKPRDIVSGDFYWVKESSNRIFVAAADCTGHGVPGSFLSMMGVSSLNDIVNLSELSGLEFNSADVLNQLRQKFISSLRIHEDYNATDGMDISLIIIDKEKMKIDFAGANNSAIIISDEKMYNIKADRMPIGSSRKANIAFSNKIIDIKKDDLIYLSSDGYRDQFGGKNGRKFSAKRLNSLLTEIKDLPLNEQKTIMEEVFTKWQGKRSQIDDVLIFALKI